MTCKHLWLKLAGGMYRWKPTEICSRCGITKPMDKPVCDHHVGLDASGFLWPVSQMKDWAIEDNVVSYKFTYCPECGEKL